MKSFICTTYLEFNIYAIKKINTVSTLNKREYLLVFLILSKSKSVKFSLIKPVIRPFTDSPA